jgi:hypothetical protein
LKKHLVGLVICVLLGMVLMFGLNTVGWMVGNLVKGLLLGGILYGVWEAARWIRR